MLPTVATLLLGLAGAAGALTRYGIGRAVGVTSFPWTTLVVNVVGSFLLGAVVVAGPSRLERDVVMALSVG